MRASGVLLPISSLSSKYGIGCFSKEAYTFIDQLVKAGQSKWQVLPLGPTGYGDSPYQPFSTFAGNPYFVDLETLIEEELLTKEECESCEWGELERYVDYEKLYLSRYKVLRKAFERFEADEDEEFKEFLTKEEHWLEDYCLYMAIKNDQNGALWTSWEEELRTQDPAAMKKMKEKLKDEIQFYRFIQFEFDKQWKKIKKYANKNGITIIGDLPIYVSLDSSDAWANPKLFQMDEKCRPTAVAGCPPDAFSETGQLWGNPLYDWKYHKTTGYRWWIRRMKRSLELYDTVRIDHFRGFSDYYSIPAEDDTAMNGHWEPGPGMDLFKALEAAISEMDVIAEDLGALDERVFELLEDSGYPGMKVLQFAFDSGTQNFYLPHHYERNCVVYTGTHDNDTTKSWYYTMPDYAREFSKAYLNNYDRPWEDISWDFIRAAEASVADLAIIPMWDLLCCGNEGRMNHPSTLGLNWKWRMVADDFKDDIIGRLRWLCDTFQRTPEEPVEEESTDTAAEENDDKAEQEAKAEADA
ncbi:MAG: 4-alpha-glucanotransferase [Clostridia bacterium]|nr:4-alpha-glucanotransferase [Clostridia bacterium]NCC43409.1 4-alpha-glucanotransferase [Clostridia bacterium]